MHLKELHQKNKLLLHIFFPSQESHLGAEEAG
jgi:hypothetical protein